MWLHNLLPLTAAALLVVVTVFATPAVGQYARPTFDDDDDDFGYVPPVSPAPKPQGATFERPAPAPRPQDERAVVTVSAVGAPTDGAVPAAPNGPPAFGSLASETLPPGSPESGTRPRQRKRKKKPEVVTLLVAPPEQSRSVVSSPQAPSVQIGVQPHQQQQHALQQPYGRQFVSTPTDNALPLIPEVFPPGAPGSTVFIPPQQRQPGRERQPEIVTLVQPPHAGQPVAETPPVQRGIQQQPQQQGTPQQSYSRQLVTPTTSTLALPPGQPLTGQQPARPSVEAPVSGILAPSTGGIISPVPGTLPPSTPVGALPQRERQRTRKPDFITLVQPPQASQPVVQIGVQQASRPAYVSQPATPKAPTFTFFGPASPKAPTFTFFGPSSPAGPVLVRPTTGVSVPGISILSSAGIMPTYGGVGYTAPNFSTRPVVLEAPVGRLGPAVQVAQVVPPTVPGISTSVVSPATPTKPVFISSAPEISEHPVSVVQVAPGAPGRTGQVRPFPQFSAPQSPASANKVSDSGGNQLSPPPFAPPSHANLPTVNVPAENVSTSPGRVLHVVPVEPVVVVSPPRTVPVRPDQVILTAPAGVEPGTPNVHLTSLGVVSDVPRLRGRPTTTVVEEPVREVISPRPVSSVPLTPVRDHTAIPGPGVPASVRPAFTRTTVSNPLPQQEVSIPTSRFDSGRLPSFTFNPARAPRPVAPTVTLTSASPGQPVATTGPALLEVRPQVQALPVPAGAPQPVGPRLVSEPIAPAVSTGRVSTTPESHPVTVVAVKEDRPVSVVPAAPLVPARKDSLQRPPSGVSERPVSPIASSAQPAPPPSGNSFSFMRLGGYGFDNGEVPQTYQLAPAKEMLPELVPAGVRVRTKSGVITSVRGRPGLYGIHPTPPPDPTHGKPRPAPPPQIVYLNQTQRYPTPLARRPPSRQPAENSQAVVPVAPTGPASVVPVSQRPLRQPAVVTVTRPTTPADVSSVPLPQGVASPVPVDAVSPPQITRRPLRRRPVQVGYAPISPGVSRPYPGSQPPSPTTVNVPSPVNQFAPAPGPTYVSQQAGVSFTRPAVSVRQPSTQQLQRFDQRLPTQPAFVPARGPTSVEQVTQFRTGPVSTVEPEQLVPHVPLIVSQVRPTRRPSHRRPAQVQNTGSPLEKVDVFVSRPVPEQVLIPSTGSALPVRPFSAQTFTTPLAGQQPVVTLSQRPSPVQQVASGPPLRLRPQVETPLSEPETPLAPLHVVSSVPPAPRPIHRRPAQLGFAPPPQRPQTPLYTPNVVTTYDTAPLLPAQVIGPASRRKPARRPTDTVGAAGPVYATYEPRAPQFDTTLPTGSVTGPPSEGTQPLKLQFGQRLRPANVRLTSPTPTGLAVPAQPLTPGFNAQEAFPPTNLPRQGVPIGPVDRQRPLLVAPPSPELPRPRETSVRRPLRPRPGIVQNVVTGYDLPQQRFAAPIEGRAPIGQPARGQRPAVRLQQVAPLARPVQLVQAPQAPAHEAPRVVLQPAVPVSTGPRFGTDVVTPPRYSTPIVRVDSQPPVSAPLAPRVVPPPLTSEVQALGPDRPTVLGPKSQSPGADTVAPTSGTRTLPTIPAAPTTGSAAPSTGNSFTFMRLGGYGFDNGDIPQTYQIAPAKEMLPELVPAGVRVRTKSGVITSVRGRPGLYGIHPTPPPDPTHGKRRPAPPPQIVYLKETPKRPAPTRTSTVPDAARSTRPGPEQPVVNRPVVSQAASPSLRPTPVLLYGSPQQQRQEQQRRQQQQQQQQQPPLVAPGLPRPTFGRVPGPAPETTQVFVSDQRQQQAPERVPFSRPGLRQPGGTTGYTPALPTYEAQLPERAQESPIPQVVIATRRPVAPRPLVEVGSPLPQSRFVSQRLPQSTPPGTVFHPLPPRGDSPRLPGTALQSPSPAVPVRGSIPTTSDAATRAPAGSTTEAGSGPSVRGGGGSGGYGNDLSDFEDFEAPATQSVAAQRETQVASGTRPVPSSSFSNNPQPISRSATIVDSVLLSQPRDGSPEGAVNVIIGGVNEGPYNFGHRHTHGNGFAVVKLGVPRYRTMEGEEPSVQVRAELPNFQPYASPATAHEQGGNLATYIVTKSKRSRA